MFGVAVLISGDAAPFLALNAPAAVIMVLLKGACAGLAGGLVFKAIEKAGEKNANRTALVTSPIAATTVFVVGYSLLVSLLINQVLADKLAGYTPLVTAVAAIAVNLVACIAGIAIYNIIKKDTRLGAVVLAGITAPVVNTAIFVIGSFIFFMPILNEWAANAGAENTGLFVLTGVVGLNFIVELSINLLLSGVIVRILNVVKKANK